MQDIITLGEFCVRHHISLQDLQLFSNDLLRYRARNLNSSISHFQNFKEGEKQVWISGDLVIDRINMTVTKDGQEERIHDHEFLLLCLLISSPHEVITDQEILEFLENHGNRVGYRSMVVYMSRLSRIVGNSPVGTHYVKRKRNKGYYWDFVTYRKG